MAILVVAVFSDSSEESVGIPARRVILFGTIPTIIPNTTPTNSPPATHTDTIEIPTIAPTTPLSPDYTPESPDYSPAPDIKFDPSEDPPSDHIPPLPAISSFLSSTDDITDSDTLDTPPSHTYEFDPSEDLPSDHIPPLPAISPFLSLTDDTIDSDTLDTPPSPTHDSSSQASSDFHSDASSDSSWRHSLSDHSSLDLPSTSVGPSRKRRRDSGYLENIEVDPRETSLRDDVIVRGSDEPHLEQDIDPEIQAEIDECIAYANALRDRGIDARVVVEAVDREESETGTRGPVEV
nr:hypothetical protein [Tanacetum cinerariifolium]